MIIIQQMPHRTFNLPMNFIFTHENQLERSAMPFGGQIHTSCQLLKQVPNFFPNTHWHTYTILQLRISDSQSVADNRLFTTFGNPVIVCTINLALSWADFILIYWRTTVFIDILSLGKGIVNYFTLSDNLTKSVTWNMDSQKGKNKFSPPDIPKFISNSEKLEPRYWCCLAITLHVNCTTPYICSWHEKIS